MSFTRQFEAGKNAYPTGGQELCSLAWRMYPQLMPSISGRWAFALLFIVVASARADVTMPAMFSEHAVVLIDAGEEADIHPKDKKTVGDRLARIALADTYGRQIISVGPAYKSMAIEADKIRVHFTHADGGLLAHEIPAEYRPSSQSSKTAALVRNSPESQLEGFAICGQDRQWKWAEAKIDEDDVLVWSASVPKPIAIRYAWADNPICNLYNGGGLPAGPFRTDDFPVSTVNAHC